MDVFRENASLDTTTTLPLSRFRFKRYDASVRQENESALASFSSDFRRKGEKLGQMVVVRENLSVNDWFIVC